MDREVNKNYSLAISWLNCVLSFLIVLLHTDFASANLEYITGVHVYTHIKQIVNVVADSAVPAFFFVSAYLLFRNYHVSDYFSKVKGRFRSVMIPYFIWSLQGIGCSILLGIITDKKIEIPFWRNFLLANAINLYGFENFVWLSIDIARCGDVCTLQ